MIPTLKGTVVTPSLLDNKTMDRNEGGSRRNGGMVPEDSFPHEKRTLGNHY